MKITRLIAAAILVSTVCTMPSFAAKPDKNDSINLKNISLVLHQGNADISLSYPQVINTTKQIFPLKDSLNRAVFAALSADSPTKYKAKVTSADELKLYCISTAAELAKFGKQNIMEAIPFNFYSSWWAFGNKMIVSVFIEKYTFAGSAHGYTRGAFLNFDPFTGANIDLVKAVADTAKLLDIAADQFCRERHLPKDALRLQTGLFCELTDLPMPSQMGCSQKGLVLYYNPYEIGPYVLGAISITIPYRYFDDVLSEKLAISKMRSGGGKIYNEKMKIQKESGRTTR